MKEFFATPRHGWELTGFITACAVIFFLILFVIHLTPSSFKKRMTIVLTFVAGLYYLLEFLIPAETHIGSRVVTNPLTSFKEPLSTALMITGSLALLLGVYNLFRINGRLLMRRKTGWQNGLAFFIGFFSMLTMAMLNFYFPTGRTPEEIAKLKPLAQTFANGADQWKGWYNVLFYGGFSALGATVFSLLAFYIVSAAYRAFRVRSPEAVMLLAAAMIMMLGLTPLGTYVLTGWIQPDSALAGLKMESIAEWILTILNGAAQRALIFGIAVGLIATSLRIWLSLERGQFFDVEM